MTKISEILSAHLVESLVASKVFGVLMKVQRYLGPAGSYELAFPAEWRLEYDEEGVPHFSDPRGNSGSLRVKTLLFRGPSAANLDPDDFLKDSLRKMPGSELVRVGKRNAVHSLERSDSTESHHWVIAEGPHVLLATYTISDVNALARSRELAAAVSILESVKFR